MKHSLFLIACIAILLLAAGSVAGELIAIGTANPVSEELYTTRQRKVFEGKLMAVVRSSGSEGDICLKARAEGLEGAEVMIQVG